MLQQLRRISSVEAKNFIASQANLFKRYVERILKWFAPFQQFRR